MSTYEIVSIVRPDLDEEALGAAIDRIHQRIVEHGGAVTSSDRWGKRRVAYPIQKYRDGFYVLTVFTLDTGQVGRLRQTLGLHEALLRFTVSTHRQSPAAARPTTAAHGTGTGTPAAASQGAGAAAPSGAHATTAPQNAGAATTRAPAGPHGTGTSTQRTGAAAPATTTRAATTEAPPAAPAAPQSAEASAPAPSDAPHV